MSTTVQSVSVRLDGTLTAVEDLVKAVDSQKIDSILTNVDKVTSTWRPLPAAFKRLWRTCNAPRVTSNRQVRTLKRV